MKKLAESYFKEAKWLNKKYKPNFKEYMDLALSTTGYPMLITISFLGMGDIVTNEVLEWLSKGPQIIKASTIICRLMDDIVSRKVYIRFLFILSISFEIKLYIFLIWYQNSWNPNRYLIQKILGSDPKMVKKQDTIIRGYGERIIDQSGVAHSPLIP